MEKIMADKYWLESFVGVDSFLGPSPGSEVFRVVPGGQLLPFLVESSRGKDHLYKFTRR